MLHDACGVGFIAHRGGRSGRDIVAHGLTALGRLAHRGAPAHLGSVDGCGVLTAIPWALLGAAFDGGLPDGATRALGMIFAAPGDRAAAVAIVDRELRRIGAAAIEWRVVPIRRDHVLPAQRGTTPEILQVAAAF